MTHKEVEIIQKLGCSSFAVYSYLNEFPRSTNTDMIINMDVSDELIRKALSKLESANVVKRIIKDGNKREIVVKSESEWKL